MERYPENIFRIILLGVVLSIPLFAFAGNVYSDTGDRPLSFYGVIIGSTNHGGSAVPEYQKAFPGGMYVNGIYSGLPVYYTGQSTIRGYTGVGTIGGMAIVPGGSANTENVTSGIAIVPAVTPSKSGSVAQKPKQTLALASNKPCTTTTVTLIKGQRNVAAVSQSYTEYMGEKLLNLWRILF